MKKYLNKYVYLSIFIALSLVISSCSDDETLEADAPKVVPLIFNLSGPTLAFQSSIATYTVGYRGGSEYVWTANNGAEIQPNTGSTYKAGVLFKNAGTTTISVYEKAFNGQISDAKNIVVQVVCNPKPGIYRVVMHDSYGDGWQTTNGDGGSGITVNIDGKIVEIGMCNPYIASSFACVTGNGYEAEATVTLPVGTISAIWNFPGDYWGEISFEIYAPGGTKVFASGASGELKKGQIPIVVCK